jgi:hypothetical protein
VLADKAVAPATLWILPPSVAPSCLPRISFVRPGGDVLYPAQLRNR